MSRKTIWIGLVLMAFCVVAMGSPLRTVDGTGAGPGEYTFTGTTWVDDEAATTLTLDTPLAGHDSALRVDPFNPGGVPFDVEVSSTDANITGNWAALGVQSVRLDFYASLPGGSMQLYFVNTGTGNTWFYDFAINEVTTGWRSYGANLVWQNTARGWYTEGGAGEAAFLADIASVDEVGVLITYDDDNVNQIYGLDNFTLDDDPMAIPEPGTYVMLGSALMSLGITFRRRLKEMLDALKEKIKA